MHDDQRGGKWKKLVAALGVVTMFGGVMPAFAVKTDLAAIAAPPLVEQAIGGRCVPEAAKDILRSHAKKIATASSVEEARELILSQTGLARKALSTASWILPFNSSVREAREKIGNLESRVYAASTQKDVARDFSEFVGLPADSNSAIVDQDEADSSPMMLAEADLNRSAVRVDTGDGHGCNYSTGEVIIIVLGFILFIIPGIIFLVIFC